MNKEKAEGSFEVIDSFAIRNRKEFYLIGNIREGNIEKSWFINIPLNASLSLTLKIKEIEKVEFPAEKERLLLLIICCDN